MKIKKIKKMLSLIKELNALPKDAVPTTKSPLKIDGENSLMVLQTKGAKVSPLVKDVAKFVRSIDDRNVIADSVRINAIVGQELITVLGDSQYPGQYIILLHTDHGDIMFSRSIENDDQIARMQVKAYREQKANIEANSDKLLEVIRQGVARDVVGYMFTDNPIVADDAIGIILGKLSSSMKYIGMALLDQEYFDTYVLSIKEAVDVVEAKHRADTNSEPVHPEFKDLFFDRICEVKSDVIIEKEAEPAPNVVKAEKIEHIPQIPCITPEEVENAQIVGTIKM